MTNAIEELRKEVGRSDGGLWTYETEHIEALLAEVERLRAELAGDGLLTLPDQVDHAREEIARISAKYEDMYSIALWATRRLSHKQHKDFAYDEIERNLGREVERV